MRTGGRPKNFAPPSGQLKIRIKKKKKKKKKNKKFYIIKDGSIIGSHKFIGKSMATGGRKKLFPPACAH